MTIELIRNLHLEQDTHDTEGKTAFMCEPCKSDLLLTLGKKVIKIPLPPSVEEQILSVLEAQDKITLQHRPSQPLVDEWLKSNSPSVHSKRPLPTTISIEDLFS